MSGSGLGWDLQGVAFGQNAIKEIQESGGEVEFQNGLLSVLVRTVRQQRSLCPLNINSVRLLYTFQLKAAAEVPSSEAALMIPILCLLPSAPALNNYPNPLYYGNWQLNFFEFDNLTNADFALFRLFFDVAPLNDTHTFIIDPIENNVKLIGPEGVSLSIGRANSKGYLDGDIKRAKFNNPKAIAFYYRPQEVKGNLPFKLTVNSFCDVNKPGCVIQKQPSFSLAFENIRFQWPSNLVKGAPTLLVADTGNNCLRSVDIRREVVTTVAGICAQQKPTVLEDGDFGFNRLLRPYELGVDSCGRVLIIDDFGHARILSNEIVTTLLIGACEYFDRQPANSQGLEIDRVLCNLRWPKWLQPDPKYTRPIERICNKQYFQCIS